VRHHIYTSWNYSRLARPGHERFTRKTIYFKTTMKLIYSSMYIVLNHVWKPSSSLILFKFVKLWWLWNSLVCHTAVMGWKTLDAIDCETRRLDSGVDTVYISYKFEPLQTIRILWTSINIVKFPLPKKKNSASHEANCRAVQEHTKYEHKRYVLHIPITEDDTLLRCHIYDKYATTLKWSLSPEGAAADGE